MKSVEELYEQMTADFSARTGVALSDSCDLAARMYVLAAQIYALQGQVEWVQRQCFPQTAVGESLDHFAQTRGLVRKQATKAVGVLRFSAAESSELNRSIPKGTVCMTPGLVRMQTTQAAVLNAGEMWVDVPAQAATAGSAGNVEAGTVTRMSVAPVGIASCTNPEPFTGGVDREGDEDLRARVMDSYRSLPNGTNAAYYRGIALADEEVSQVLVVPRPRGVGSVDVIVSAHYGQPSAELLARLKARLDEAREIAVDLQVLPPEPVAVELSVQVAPEKGADADAVVQEVDRAVRDFFNGGLLGEDLLLVRLGSVIYGCEGVENYRILAPAQDMVMEPAQLPVLGSLQVEVMA